MMKGIYKINSMPELRVQNKGGQLFLSLKDLKSGNCVEIRPNELGLKKQSIYVMLSKWIADKRLNGTRVLRGNNVYFKKG